MFNNSLKRQRSDNLLLPTDKNQRQFFMFSQRYPSKQTIKYYALFDDGLKCHNLKPEQFNPHQPCYKKVP